MLALHQTRWNWNSAAAFLTGAALAVTLSSCGQGAVIAASLQFTLSAPTSISVRTGNVEPAPLLVTVAHLISTPITVPISLTLDNPPPGIHAQDVTVGIGQSSATLNVYVDNIYAGDPTTVLTVKGTALQVTTQKVNVTLQITRGGASIHEVQAPITPGQFGLPVANLQNVLLALLERGIIRSFNAPERPTSEDLIKLTEGLKQERVESMFGASTSQLVLDFQIQQGLGDNLRELGVEQTTAHKLNEWLVKLSLLN